MAGLDGYGRGVPVSVDAQGRTYPPTRPYRVSAEKIAEFAAALGDDNPAYRGPEPVAPPTFAAVIAAQAWGALFDDPELDVALARTIHADQSFEWSRQLKAGDEVTAVLTLDRVRTRGPMEMITVATAIATTDGEPICTARSQLIHTRPASDSSPEVHA